MVDSEWGNSKITLLVEALLAIIIAPRLLVIGSVALKSAASI